MGKKLVMFVCLAFLTMGAFAQQNNDERRREGFERFKKEREAFIKEELKLSDVEAKAFLPLVDQLQMAKFQANEELRTELRKLWQARRDGKAVADADYKKIVELSAQVKIKEAELEAEYIEKFLKVVSAEKIYLYQRAEQEFARKRTEQHRSPDRPEGQRPQGDRPGRN